MRDLAAIDCCDNRFHLDFNKMVIPVNCFDHHILLAVVCILFSPLYWNVMARWEYNTRILSRTCRSPKLACIVLAVTIFLLGVYRHWRFYDAMKSQARSLLMQQNGVLWTGHCLVLCGIMLVATSYWALGFYGTFLGDYFGILMPAKVTGFPFSVMNNPMYWGSTLNFLGASLVRASPAGILMSLLVAVVYKVAISYEEPFTNRIYAEAAAKK